MPTKVLSIFGSPASGKTTLALMLAYQFCAHGKNVTLISVDRTVPQAKVILPLSAGERKQSLGELLLTEPSERSIVESLLFHPNLQRLGLLSFQSGDTETMYPPTVDKERYRNILNTLYRHCDYLIIDCTSNPLTNSLTLASLELADKTISLYTPDHAAIEWKQSVYTLLKDNRFRADEHLSVLSPCHPFSPTEEASKTLLPFCLLPFSQEVYNHRIAGTVFSHKNVTTQSGNRYLTAIDKIAKEVTTDAGQ